MIKTATQCSETETAELRRLASEFWDGVCRVAAMGGRYDDADAKTFAAAAGNLAWQGLISAIITDMRATAVAGATSAIVYGSGHAIGTLMADATDDLREFVLDYFYEAFDRGRADYLTAQGNALAERLEASR